MNYQTANQDEIFYSHKTKLLSDHLVEGGKKIKGRAPRQPCRGSVIANGIDGPASISAAWPCLEQPESDRQASLPVPHPQQKAQPPQEHIQLEPCQLKQLRDETV